MRRLIMVAALAAASTSFALAPALANNDNPGVDDLGVDISSVPLTPSGVHSFLSSLAPDARRAVEAACVNYTQRGEAGVDEQTLAFCDQAHRA